MAFAPGMTVGQNLRLVRELARGGMGSVWIANHLGLKTQVAVKFIDESLGEDSNVLARFAREAAAAAQIRSPHVVQIFDHGFIDGRVPYIVMELLEGESMGGRIQRLGVLALDEVAVIVMQMCRALSRAHALGVVHRDIKPDNIFLTDSDGDLFVKVLDFGIAKRKDDETLATTQTGVTVGTPHYMSPEQLLSAKNAVPATDLWAVAAAVYRALSGQLPFDAETFAGLCITINQGVFKPVSEHRPDLPAPLDDWFSKALAVNPAARFGSARELSEAFVVAAGLSAHRLAVPSALPPKAAQEAESRQPSSPSNTDPRTSTVALPPEFSDSAPVRSGSGSGATTDLPSGRSRPGYGGTGGSGASIAGASMPNSASFGLPSRSRVPLFSAVAVVLLGVVALVVVLARRGSSQVADSTSRAPSGSAEAAPSPTPAALAATAAATATNTAPTVPAAPGLDPSETRGGDSPWARPAPTTAPPDDGPLLRRPGHPSILPPAHSTVRAPHAAQPATTPPATTPPAAAPANREIDHGF